MGRLFGTDGVRGVANLELTPELAFKLGRAAAIYFGRETVAPKIIIGRDTRLSGQMLEAALAAGICSAGGNAHLLGVIPTPAVSFLTAEMKANAGAVISASHNPFEDNGIKFFSRTGHKLPDAVEDEIEDIVAEPVEAEKTPIGSSVGRIIWEKDKDEEYIKHIVKSADTDLNGLKVVIDCANGANSVIGPEVLRRLGAEVIPLFNTPNGININNGCGSTHMEELQRVVLETGAAAGIANDGDADRCLAVDEQGNILDGDQIMLICALELLKKGKLKDNVLVTTVMSNIGLHKAIKEHGGRCIKTKVGDRYVLEEMLKENYQLGGEQSGHIIFSEFAKTGDGILTAVRLLGAMVKNNQTLSSMGALMKKYPQILLNVRVNDKNGWEEKENINKIIKHYEELLGEDGQILVRASGTEPLIRIMAEGPCQTQLESIAAAIAEVITKELA
ncbi:MAG TPA: phosphoglucosamine mutase [Candidatus Avacidaminococcus intestinavium]|uniref:Phosphoglucosamine mutase n=1 Tax=Candidatus Avacidaminococcus intestinavium TaxID=2840684 RepID=A0A9D1MN83_9FIRM|nr:phosphoglucosamine mutase [Candidatus Avacidaminococcus intestinavium]